MKNYLEKLQKLKRNVHLLELIKKRRAVFPESYQPDQTLDQKTVEQLLEAAAWAPSHKLSQPWRFYVYRDKSARQKLGLHMAQAYQAITSREDFSEIKYQKFLSRPVQSACVLVISMVPAEGLPEWEEIAAVAASVQNMWLMCTDIGLGSYWSTPNFFLSAAADFLPFAPNEKCLGLFYIGITNNIPPPTKRKNWSEISTWM